MDPLSISARIAGLVDLADVVFGRVYKYGKSVKSASKDITALSTQIGALYDILSSLRLLTDQLENDEYESTTKTHHLYGCYQTLEKIKRLLPGDTAMSSSNPDQHTLKNRLLWPFKSSEIKSLIAEIENHKSALSLALNADGMSGLLRALPKQDRIDEGTKTFKLK